MPPTLKTFAAEYEVTENQLAAFMLEPGFWDKVVSDVNPFKERVREVKMAVLKNALDASRSDQLEWIRVFSRMIGYDLLREGEGAPPKEDEGTRVIKLRMKS